MADEVLSGQEVILNSIRYPLKGQVSPVLTSRFAPKQVQGDYELDSDPDRSAWAVNDQRGGLLSEEKIKQIENRCWWSTCNLSYKGHIVLPRLATEVPFKGWVSMTSSDNPGDWTNEANAFDLKTETYATATQAAPTWVAVA